MNDVAGEVLHTVHLQRLSMGEALAQRRLSLLVDTRGTILQVGIQIRIFELIMSVPHSHPPIVLMLVDTWGTILRVRDPSFKFELGMGEVGVHRRAWMRQLTANLVDTRDTTLRLFVRDQGRGGVHSHVAQRQPTGPSAAGGD